MNLRLTDVANATGIPAQQISEWEKGLRRLHPRDQLAIEKFLTERLKSELEADLESAAIEQRM